MEKNDDFIFRNSSKKTKQSQANQKAKFEFTKIAAEARFSKKAAREIWKWYDSSNVKDQ